MYNNNFIVILIIPVCFQYEYKLQGVKKDKVQMSVSLNGIKVIHKKLKHGRIIQVRTTDVFTEVHYGIYGDLKQNIPVLGSQAFNVDVSMADCGDWRRFAILLTGFDFVTQWTKIKIHPNFPCEINLGIPRNS